MSEPGRALRTLKCKWLASKYEFGEAGVLGPQDMWTSWRSGIRVRTGKGFGTEDEVETRECFGGGEEHWGPGVA